VSVNPEIENASPEGGTANLAELAPAFAVKSMLNSAAVSQKRCGVKERILLVEDEAFVRKATAEALESEGYQVMLACSATQALDQQSHFEVVDLLLADVVMPGISGHELASEFLALRPEVRILLMSGYSEELALWETSPYRREYLAKPFSIPTLLRRVREVLDKNPFAGVGSA
jgi:two-component system cell cycle sensor histidine kinase/response regulator CckA